jgi:hypothetical protein
VGGESLYKLFDSIYDISTVKDYLVFRQVNRRGGG